MAYFMIRQKVNNYSEWLVRFHQAADREKNDVRDLHILRDLVDPSLVTIFIETQDASFSHHSLLEPLEKNGIAETMDLKELRV